MPYLKDEDYQAILNRSAAAEEDLKKMCTMPLPPCYTCACACQKAPSAIAGMLRCPHWIWRGDLGRKA